MIEVRAEKKYTEIEQEKTIRVAVDEEIPNGDDSFSIRRTYQDKVIKEITGYEPHDVKVIGVSFPESTETYYEHEKEMLLEDVGEEAIPFIKEAGWQ